jgi:hypothetical protein
VTKLLIFAFLNFSFVAFVRAESGLRDQSVRIESAGGVCSGAVINSTTVLTAAHCAPISVEGISIREFIQHPDFKSTPTDRNDVALLKLNAPLPSKFQQVKIHPQLKLIEGDQLRVFGFGRRFEGIEHRLDFVRYLDSSFTEFTLQNVAGGLCFGDSGAPAFVEWQGEYYMVGLVSRGLNGTCEGEALLMTVARHLEWIGSRLQMFNSIW